MTEFAICTEQSNITTDRHFKFISLSYYLWRMHEFIYNMHVLAFLAIYLKRNYVKFFAGIWPLIYLGNIIHVCMFIYNFCAVTRPQLYVAKCRKINIFFSMAVCEKIKHKTQKKIGVCMNKFNKNVSCWKNLCL